MYCHFKTMVIMASCVNDKYERWKIQVETLFNSTLSFGLGQRLLKLNNYCKSKYLHSSKGP